MGRVLEAITDELAAWIRAQHMFFVATAPLGADGHVNVSPKGFAGSFVVLGPHEVAYLDRIGSGAETIAHLRENGRITVMFNAFDGKPDIVRLYGHGVVIRPGDERFETFATHFPDPPRGIRSVIHVRVDRVSSSCGFGVPFMEYVGDRETMA
ncbi:MAG: pyridoxamine 5'-phosphate oxidase family protein, partial [Actinobacteria bacterium]|nr:pyridoxamine 5'-phosphate oxidase family protein [Actinomycetota bacterium]